MKGGYFNLSVFSTSLLQKFCSEEWVAKAYSDYLMACANEELSFVSEVVTASQDATLEELIDQLSSLYMTTRTEIKDAVSASLRAKGCLPSVALDVESPEFHTEFAILTDPEQGDEYVRSLFEDLTARNQWWGETFADASASTRYQGIFGEDLIDQYLVTADDASDRLDALITTVMEKFHFDQTSTISLNKGFANAKQLIRSLITHYGLGIETSSVLTLPLVDFKGVSIPSAEGYFSFDDVVSDLKASAASAIAWAEGFAATMSGTVTDALQSFDAKIRTVFDNSTAAFSQSVNQVRAFLADTKANVSSFFNVAYEEWGWRQVAQDLFHTEADTPVASYTGASPLGAVNFKSATDVLSATGRTLLAVGKGIFDGAKALVQKAWGKIRPYVKALTNDPEDFKLSDTSDVSYCVDNYKMQEDSFLTFTLQNSGASFNPTRFTEFVAWAENHMTEQWYAIETAFFECNFKFGHVTLGTDALNRPTLTLGQTLFQMRPRCLAYKTLLEYGIAHLTSAGTRQEAVAFLPTAVSNETLINLVNTPEFRPDNDASEEELYMGFVSSILLGANVLSYCHTDMGTECYNGYGWKCSAFSNEVVSNKDLISPVPEEFYVGGGGRTYPDTITNLDAIKVCCGYKPNQLSVNSYMWYYSADFGASPSATPSNTAHGCVSNIMAPFLAMLLYQQYEKFLNPQDYIFLPYCRGTYAFSDGRYHIRTDEENADIANLITTVLVVIVTIAAVFLIGAAAIKLLKVAKLGRLTSKLGPLDNQTWNGKPLSLKQSYKYRRLQKKLGRLNDAGSGLAGAASTVNTVLETVQNISGMVVPSDVEANQTAMSTLADDQSLDGIAKVIRLVAPESV